MKTGKEMVPGDGPSERRRRRADECRGDQSGRFTFARGTRRAATPFDSVIVPNYSATAVVKVATPNSDRCMEPVENP